MALTAACASRPTIEIEAPASELTETPFFSQKRYQCGPAALATVLVASGVSVSPDDLVPEVYLPERKGSLQLELMASARRHGRLPYPLAPDVASVLEEVAAGSPVLVLQNLGVAWLPVWHYAVVVGYDPGSNSVLLRSGRQARRQESLARFDRSWQLADRWAVRMLRPGSVPATGDAATYLRTVMNGQRVFPESEILLALESGVERWPNAADMAFATANQVRKMGELDRARSYYEQALKVDPGHLGAMNNLADLLLTIGEIAPARQVIDQALRLVPGDSQLRAVIEATSREISAREGG